MNAFSKTVLFALLMPVASACATTAKPAQQNPASAGAVNPPCGYWPSRNTDPTCGALINAGGMPLDVVIKDQAGRILHVMRGFPGATVPIPGVNLLNNIRRPAMLFMRLPPGDYRVEYIPYYFTPRWFFVIPVGMDRIDLPRQSSGITVSQNDPAAVYDDWTKRHWGWRTILNGGDIPPDPVFSNIKINFSCC